MKYLSLFHGIGAVDLAWMPLGWECVAFAEIEAFPVAVTKHHHPTIPNLGDVTKITDEQIAALGPIDLVVGGSPCQDLSVAGKRAGLAGERSGLFHEQLRIFDAARHLCGARWLLWENVPGAFSTHGGRDFAVVVGSMVGCGFGVPRGGWGTCGAAAGQRGLVEWRTLDAQYVRVQSHPAAVPQRRRRVFALLDSGAWADRPPILLEPEGLRGDPAPRRQQGERPSPCLEARARGGGGGWGTDFLAGGGLTEVFGPGAEDVSHSLSTRDQKGPCSNLAQGTLVAEVCGSLTDGAKNGAGTNGQDAYTGLIIPVTQPIARNGRGSPSDVVPPLKAQSGESGKGDGAPLVAIGFDEAADPVAANQARTYTREGTNNFRVSNVAISAMQVRRLTPRECERLQGFPDDYTLVQVKGKPAADGPRYKALGNSMAVNVMRWIGERIDAALAYERERDAA